MVPVDKCTVAVAGEDERMGKKEEKNYKNRNMEYEYGVDAR